MPGSSGRPIEPAVRVSDAEGERRVDCSRYRRQSRSDIALIVRPGGDGSCARLHFCRQTGISPAPFPWRRSPSSSRFRVWPPRPPPGDARCQGNVCFRRRRDRQCHHQAAPTSGLSAAPFFLVYQHRLTDIPLDTVWSWLALFLGVEFFYYWFHLASHRIRWLVGDDTCRAPLRDALQPLGRGAARLDPPVDGRIFVFPAAGVDRIPPGRDRPDAGAGDLCINSSCIRRCRFISARWNGRSIRRAIIGCIMPATRPVSTPIMARP